MEILESKLSLCFDGFIMIGSLKKLTLLTALLTGLVLLGDGCSSVSPNCSIPEWEQARAENSWSPGPVEDFVWQVFAFVGETLACTN